jgi:hypothetical protein
MSETGPTPDTKSCFDCGSAVIWLWSPRVHRGLGGWVKFQTVTADGMTIRSHRCREPRGEFDYQASEEQP